MLGRLKFHRLWIWYGLYLLVDNIFCRELPLCLLVNGPNHNFSTRVNWFDYVLVVWSASMSSVDMLFVFGTGFIQLSDVCEYMPEILLERRV